MSSVSEGVGVSRVPVKVGDTGVAVPPPHTGVGGPAGPGVGVRPCPGLCVLPLNVKASAFLTCVSPVSCWCSGCVRADPEVVGQRLSGQWDRGRLAGGAEWGRPAAAAAERSQSQFHFLVTAPRLPGAFRKLAPILSIWNAVALSRQGLPRQPARRGLCAVPRLPEGPGLRLGNSKPQFYRGFRAVKARQQELLDSKVCERLGYRTGLLAAPGRYSRRRSRLRGALQRFRR